MTRLLPAVLFAVIAVAPLSARAESLGAVEVSRLRAPGAETTLGHGGLVIAAGDPADSGQADGLPIYEAAVAAALARLGYDTATAAPTGGQIAEIQLSHAMIQPPEPPHRPVSGVASTTIGNRGSGFGLGLNFDFTKPKRALVSTRLAVRIRDRATGRVLWEGRADLAARDTESGLEHGKIADRLTRALFAGFPQDAKVVAAQ